MSELINIVKTAAVTALSVCLFVMATRVHSQGQGLPAEEMAAADEGELIDIGGFHLYFNSIGKGSPAVIIEPGFGDDAANWLPLAVRLAESTRVCLYDRAGYGRSEPGPLPRSAAQVNAELLELLEAAGVEPPYVLVGHSLGGLYCYLFALSHREKTAGLVLLDPPPLPFLAGERFTNLLEMAERMTSELARGAEAARESRDPAAAARAARLETMASEHDMMFTAAGTGTKTLGEIGNLGDLPLVVIGSGQANPVFGDSAQAFQEFWINENKKLAGKSTRGRFVLAAGSGHNLYVEAPDVVLSAVRELVEEIRGYVPQ